MFVGRWLVLVLMGEAEWGEDSSLRDFFRVIFFLYFLLRNEAKYMGLGSVGGRCFKETYSWN